MTNAIYRMSLSVLDYQELIIPGKPLSVGADRGGAQDIVDLWYEHSDDVQTVTHGLYMMGTGHAVPWAKHMRVEFSFLGTVITPYLVWHVFTGPVR